MAATIEAPGRVGVWLAASRPKTLPAAAAPVVLGSAIAVHAGAMNPGPALAALVGALLLQIGANLSNDYYDYLKGADGPDRVGPTRATQAGWVTPGAMLRATILVFMLASVVGAYLVWAGGWPILAVGLAAIATAVAYTGGPFPLAYLGLGEVAAFVFFGPVAVLGTVLVQAHALSPVAWWLAAGPGFLAAALLGVNNLRDRPTDARVGKHTLAVRFGAKVAKGLYVAETAIAFAIPVALWALGQVGPGVLLSLGAIAALIPPLKLVLTAEGAILNKALGGTGRLLLVYGVLLAIGLVWRG